MLCSRRVMEFLSLKTDFLERMATRHGLTSWRGHTGREEKGAVPKSAVAPGSCLPLCHAAPFVHTQPLRGCHFPQTQHGYTQLLNPTEYGTRPPHQRHLGRHREAGLGRIWAQYCAWEGKGLAVLFGT